MELPSLLLESLRETKGFNKEAFKKIHESGEQITSVRFNPAKVSMVNGEWSIRDSIDYSPFTIHQKIPFLKQARKNPSPFTLSGQNR